ncbi:CBL-interacting serine/threonine-protein kinase 15 [Acorus gramineus]|uniref:CBL-interacting serine/threonine-protein kinase 15 n=1 Tax=Acorus gramineus TaxID=55184 RepID=A0AAV9BGF1_ACOGR|nr:CBL-interacting serine/threonine-protein kinase 15 [Acorus gramineus]
MGEKEKRRYPIRAEDYKLHEEVGHGVSATVYRAQCIPLNETVAIKIIDLEKSSGDLGNISREAQTMILVDHPNLLKAHCTFANDHNLWVVMPYMAGGSCLHIMKHAHSNGFEEEAVIATILREVLKGMNYLHSQGFIHRDVKAGNILVDSHGAIKLGDFGVSAYLFDSGDRQRMRNTFVGTPCWMAPEVMEQLNGYDFKADMWSFGITALELAHGHAPFSKYPPMKVFLMTMQNAPPVLNINREKKFSKLKEDDMIEQKKIPDGKKEEMSQNEYKRGISAWNFDMEDLKTQASLIPDVEEIISEKDVGGNSNSIFGLDSIPEKQHQCALSITSQSSKDDFSDRENEDLMQSKAALSISPDQLPVYTLKGKFEASDDELSVSSSTCDQNFMENGVHFHDNSGIHSRENSEVDINRKQQNGSATDNCHDRRLNNTNCQLDAVQSFKGERQTPQKTGTCNGTAVLEAGEDARSEVHLKSSKIAVSNGNELDEKAKGPVIQQKGRFKVTSENMGLDKVITQPPAFCLPSPSESMSIHPDSSPLNILQYMLQINSIQKENIILLMKQQNSGDVSGSLLTDGSSLGTAVTLDKSSASNSLSSVKPELPLSNREQLMQENADLHRKLACLQEEVQRLKAKGGQM